MVKPPQNLTALDGKDATISCKAQGAPAPNITWFVNGKTYFSYNIQKILIYLCSLNRSKNFLYKNVNIPVHMNQ